MKHLETCFSIAEADRVLCHLVMVLLNCLFPLDIQKKYSCYHEYLVIHGWFAYRVFG